MGKLEEEELRNARLEQEETNRQMTELYDFAPVGYLSFNEKGQIVKANLTVAQQLAVERDVLTQQFFVLYLRKEAQDRFYLHLKEVFESPKPSSHNPHSRHQHFCKLLLHGKQEIRTVLLNSVLGKSVNGEQLCNTTVTEIPEQDDGAGRELYKLSEALRQSPTSVIVTDANGDIEYVNPEFIKTMGYSSEELVGQNPRVFQSGVHSESFYQDLWNSIKSGNTWKNDICNKRKNGEFFWELQCISPVMDSDGKIINFVAVKFDDTIRREAEDALRESHDKYRVFFESGQNAILVLDIESQRFEESNPAALKLFGYSRKEFYQLSPKNLFADFEKTNGVIELFKEGSIESKHIAECPLRTKNGGNKLGEISAEIFQSQGHKKLMVTIRDITQSKELEQQLYQSQKMEAIGMLAGGVAHDLNNILAPIFVFSELALERMAPESGGYDDVKQVVKAAERARDLVGQILIFSRKTKLEKKLIQPEALIKESLKLIRSTLPTTVRIKQENKPPVPSILADPAQINQVLMNLCINACHAMPDGGDLKITLSTQELPPITTSHGLAIKGSFACLEVQDTGCGMEETTLKQIFAPFFSTKEAGKGTGLGLSVVMRIVEQHGGHVKADSQVGVGTRFYVYLPSCNKGKKFLSSLPKIKRAPLRGVERILFVDDDPGVNFAVTGMLDDLGYEVSSFLDSQEALSTFRDEPQSFDLVITDYTMPKLTGTQLAKFIKATRPEIPIIICTGYSESITKENLHEWGLDELLLKPCKRDEFSQAIRRALNRDKTKT